MAASPAFEWTCTALEAGTSFNSLEARGTTRLALKSAGLEASSVDPAQMTVVLEKVLPDELTHRGVENADSLCGELARRLRSENLESAQGDTPEAVFARLGSGR